MITSGTLGSGVSVTADNLSGADLSMVTVGKSQTIVNEDGDTLISTDETIDFSSTSDVLLVPFDPNVLLTLGAPQPLIVGDLMAIPYEVDIRFFDLTDPLNPVVEIPLLPMPGASSISLLIGGLGYHIVPSVGQIVISNLATGDPNNPSSLGGGDHSMGAAFLAESGAAAVSGNHLYVVGNIGGGTPTGQMVIMDVSTPAAPIQAAILPNRPEFQNVKDMAASAGYLYMTYPTADEILIYDVGANPASPSFAGDLSLANPQHVKVLSNGLLCVTRNEDPGGPALGGFDLYDLSTPNSPSLASSIDAPSGISGLTGIADTGNVLYLTAPSDQALLAYDITNPLSPVLIEVLDDAVTFPLTGHPEFLATSADVAYVPVGGTIRAFSIIDSIAAADRTEIVADSFVGDGSGLTNLNLNLNSLGDLNPTNVFAAASVTGVNLIATNVLSGNSANITNGLSAGSIAATGTVTAGSFVGDGSSLTSIQASAISGNLNLGAGTVTANSFVGDGSGLTGVTAVSVPASGITGDVNGFAVGGTFGSGSNPDPVSGEDGARMFWYPAKAAFRAGQTIDALDPWDDDLIGAHSAAFGRDTFASGVGSFAAGSARTFGDYSAAFGEFTFADNDHAVVIGKFNKNISDALFVIGFGSDTSNRQNVFSVKENGDTTLAGKLTASGITSTGSFTQGTSLTNTGLYSIAVGSTNVSSSNYSVAFGFGNQATGLHSFSGGNSSKATSTNAFAFGKVVNATHTESAAFGTGTNTVVPNHFVVGRYNTTVNASNHLFTVGDGTSTARSDAFIVTSTGVLAHGYFNFSDRCLKENIAPIRDVLESVLALQPSHYTWKERPDKGQQIGVIAQEVQPLFPELVNDSGAHLAVDYDAFGVLAIAAIQEQQEMIDDIKTENTKLKVQLSKQEERLAALEKLMTESSEEVATMVH